MAATRKNIVIEQGGKFELTVQAKNADGTPMDLTSYTGKMQVRPSASSSTVLLEASTANGRVAIDPLNGVVAVVIGADVTGPLTWRVGVYDLEVTSSVSEIRRIAEGFAYLSPEVTR